MSAQMKAIKIWGKHGPNPVKVAMILEELEVPYEVIDWAMADVKKPEYLTINPNGRLPAIYDPNTELMLWESGAIIEYLIDRYDKNQRLSFTPGSNESYLAKQWLVYQTTGQGPYFGQAAWFKKFTPEPNQAALQRYVNEVNRVSGVLDGYLATNGPWLVGGRISYADIAFFMWEKVIAMVLEKDEYSIDNYPHVKEWIGKIGSRKGVKAVFDSI